VVFDVLIQLRKPYRTNTSGYLKSFSFKNGAETTILGCQSLESNRGKSFSKSDENLSTTFYEILRDRTHANCKRSTFIFHFLLLHNDHISTHKDVLAKQQAVCTAVSYGQKVSFQMSLVQQTGIGGVMISALNIMKSIHCRHGDVVAGGGIYFGVR